MPLHVPCCGLFALSIGKAYTYTAPPTVPCLIFVGPYNALPFPPRNPQENHNLSSVSYLTKTIQVTHDVTRSNTPRVLVILYLVYSVYLLRSFVLIVRRLSIVYWNKIPEFGNLNICHYSSIKMETKITRSYNQ